MWLLSDCIFKLCIYFCNVLIKFKAFEANKITHKSIDVQRYIHHDIQHNFFQKQIRVWTQYCKNIVTIFRLKEKKNITEKMIKFADFGDSFEIKFV